MGVIRVRNTLEHGGIIDAIVSAFNTLVTNCNASVGSITGVNAIKTDHNLAATDITALRATLAAVQLDVVALRATLAATQLDVVALRGALATLTTAHNSKTTDTVAAPAAVGSSAPAAVGSSAPAAVGVQGSVPAVTAGGITASNTLNVISN